MPPVNLPKDIYDWLSSSDGVISGQLGASVGGVAAAFQSNGIGVVVHGGLILDGLTQYEDISVTALGVTFDFYEEPTIYCQAADGLVFRPKSNPTIVIKVSAHSFNTILHFGIARVWKLRD